MPAVRSPLQREEDILKEALNQVRARLPKGWALDLQSATALFGPDAVVSLRSPQGETCCLLVGVKRTLVTRDLKAVVDQLRDYASALPDDEQDPRKRGRSTPMVIARYLSPPLQDWMTDQGVPYADATGNVRIAVDRPALFLRDVGASKDPWRGPGRPKSTLTGEPAARVVRALVDFTPPYSVPTVIKLSGASNATTYRVIELLEDQLLLERRPRGPIEDVKWRALLDRWARDYGFTRTNPTGTYLAPRGLDELTSRLAADPNEGDTRYAVTGSLAAQRWAPYAPARNAMIYTSDPAAFADRLGLRDVDAGANVLLARAAYDVVFDRTQDLDGVAIVAPSQAAVDLITGPGRNPAEAEALMDWMENNEQQWRR